eukprot:gene4480-5255_t
MANRKPGVALRKISNDRLQRSRWLSRRSDRYTPRPSAAGTTTAITPASNARVATQGRAEPAQVLPQDRLVQPQLMLQGEDAFQWRVGAEDHPGRVRWQRLGGDKHHQADHPRGEQAVAQAADKPR